jgi:glycosyltransferase involved in cell wall biosynthesis
MTILKDWEFWIAGEGDITSQLKSLTAQLNLEQRVKFLGWVHPDQLASLLNQAKLGINMLEEGSLSYYYSLSNKFFDCIHAGIPSINMNYPEYRRINDKYPCSILLDEVTPEKIAPTIQFLDNNPAELIRMSNACKEASKEYNWENESAKLVEMYSKLLNS